MGACGGSFAKQILSLINLIFIIISLIFVLHGLRAEFVDGADRYLEFWSNISMLKRDHLSLTIILISVIIFLVSIFGFLASMGHSRFMLKCYSYVLLFFMVIVVFGETFSLFQMSKTDFDKGSLNFRRLMLSYSHNNHSHQFIDNLQSMMLCCGDRSPQDWHNSSFSNQITIDLANDRGTRLFGIFDRNKIFDEKQLAAIMRRSISNNTGLIPQGYYPSSCCHDSNIQYNGTFCNETDIEYQDGCFSKTQYTRYKYFINLLMLTIFLLLLSMLVLTCCLELDCETEQAKLMNQQYVNHLQSCPLNSSLNKKSKSNYGMAPYVPSTPNRNRYMSGTY